MKHLTVAFMLLMAAAGSGCLVTKVAQSNPQSESPHDDVLIPELKGVVIIPSAEDVKSGGRPGIVGAVVEGPGFLTKEKVQSQLERFFGKPFSQANLVALQKDLVRLCRAEDHPVVDVVLPEQEIVDGVVEAGPVSFQLPIDILEATVRDACRFAHRNRAALRLVMRHVLDRGALDPERTAHVLLPFLAEVSGLISPFSSESPMALRMSLQSIVFLIVRYALMGEDELRLVTNQGDKARESVEDHVVKLAITGLGLQESGI